MYLQRQARKTLVWHWPGSSWPPSSDSPNLWVVDGTSPGSVAMSAGQVETEFILGASIAVKEATFLPKAASNAVAPCVVTDLDANKLEEKNDDAQTVGLQEATTGKQYEGVCIIECRWARRQP